MGSGRGLCLGPTGLEKALGALGGVGLRLKEQKGPRRAPHSWPQRAGDLGAQQPSWAQAGRANALLSSPAPPAAPVLEDPPTCLSCSPLGLLPMPAGPMRPGGGWDLGGQGTGLGVQQAAQARVGGTIVLRSSPASPRGPLPPTSPDLPGLRGANPVWPPLLLPPQSPHILPIHLVVPPISLGIRVPHQRSAGSLVVGRC